MKLLRTISLLFATLLIINSINAQCDPPVNSTTNIYSTQVTLNWTPVQDAVEYMVIASVLGVSTIDTFYYPGSDSVVVFGGLSPDKSFQWAVKSICDSTESALSAVLTFTTLSADTCPPPYELHAHDISNTSANLSWDAVPGAVAYQLSLNGSAAASPVNSYFWDNLVPNSSNIWGVSTICGIDTVPASWDTGVAALDTFITVDCPLPDTFYVEEIGPDSVRISWSSVPDASFYNLSGLSLPGIVMVNDTTYVASMLTPNTLYTFNLQVVCNNGVSDFFSVWSDTLEVTTSAAGPSCDMPIPISTSNITLETAMLSWTPVASAVSYKVSGKELGASSYIDLTFNSSFSSFEASGLSQGVTYVWKVLANCATDTSAHTPEDTFTTLLCPTPTGLIDTFETNVSVYLAWNKVDEAVNYRLYGKEASSSTIATYVLPPDTVIFINSLMNNTTYFWAVQAICNDTTNLNSYLSAVSSFTTTAGVSEKANDFDVSSITLFPNPASEFVNLNNTVPVEIVLFTADGKEMISTEKASFGVLDVSSFPQGVYILQATSSDGVSTRKLIIER